jgi:hypothetical protein
LGGGDGQQNVEGTKTLSKTRPLVLHCYLDFIHVFFFSSCQTAHYRSQLSF